MIDDKVIIQILINHEINPIQFHKKKGFKGITDVKHSFLEE